jgi:hypothetical protein
MSIKKTVAIVAAAGALTALALPALAETSFYGSARVGTFWDTNQPLQAVGAAKPDTNTDFILNSFATSRFGANFSNGNLGGKVELGVGGPAVSTAGTVSAAVGTGGATYVYTRHAYGTYKFDAGTLLVGQTWTPYTFASEQVALDDNVNNGYGSLYDARLPQVRFTLNNGVYVAVLRNGGAAANVNGEAGTTAGAQTLFPKVAVGYEGKAGNIAFGGGVAGQTFKANNDTQVTSILGYVHGVLTAGPAALALNIGVGQNLGDFGIGGTTGATATSVAGSTDVYNTTTISALIQGSYQITPMVKGNVGLGYVTESGKNANNTSWTKDDNKMALFVNAPITLAKGVTLVPEISYIDQLDEKNGDTGKKDTIYGAKWQMDF